MSEREVIVDPYATRGFVCLCGFTWEVSGETTWNPWGSPDWRAKSADDLACPKCGEHNSKRKRERCCGIRREHGALTSARPCADCPEDIR